MGRLASQIAKERRERQRPAGRQGRSENTRPVEVRFLIVCEGEKTEPNYFEALIKAYKTKGSVVRIAAIEGVARGTSSLVKRAIEIQRDLERRNAMSFDSKWVVFDKDDFSDFGQAIQRAGQADFKSAWSNEAFELWYYLHFHYLDAAISREDYIKKLEGFLSERIEGTFSYQKNDPQMYDLLQRYGNEERAKKWACSLQKMHYEKPYSDQCPCTTVNELVDEIESPERLISSVTEHLS